jgi:hypothetical protein
MSLYDDDDDDDDSDDSTETEVEAEKESESDSEAERTAAPEPETSEEPTGDEIEVSSIENPRSGGPPSEDRDSTEREASTVPAPNDGDGGSVEQGGGGLLGVVVLIVAMIALGAITPNGAGQTAPRHPYQL